MKKLILITVLSLFSSVLAAQETASQELPFIGKKIFNFMGGNGTQMSLEINKKRQYKIKSYGVENFSSVESKGIYSNPLPASYEEDDDKYLIYDNKIYLINKNNEIQKDCMGDGSPCVSELYDLN
jgi:hypothetical protein